MSGFKQRGRKTGIIPGCLSDSTQPLAALHDLPREAPVMSYPCDSHRMQPPTMLQGPSMSAVGGNERATRLTTPSLCGFALSEKTFSEY